MHESPLARPALARPDRSAPAQRARMRGRRRSRPSPGPMHRVEILEHVCERWHVPAQVVDLPAPDADSARLAVVRTALAQAGAPPWRPLLRLSLGYTTARRLPGGAR
jgi:hypothetical protein